MVEWVQSSSKVKKSLESFEQVRGSVMPVVHPPTRSIEASDPHNVAETFVNGPFNIVRAAGMVHFAFTAVRPNPSDLFKGGTTPELQATVACRLVMPMEMVEQLTRTLAATFSKAAPPVGTSSEIVKLTNTP
jgi:hypothetical protein